MVTLHLTVNHQTTGDTTAVACDRFDWYEHENITASTETLTHTFVGANQYGCDSVVTLFLTVNYHHDYSFNAQGTGSYTWGQGENYEETFTENGVYHRTITTYQGCDSNITLTVSIASSATPIPVIYSLMDVMLLVNHFADEATERIDYIYYRWYKDGKIVKEGIEADSYDEGGAMLNGCYYLEISTSADTHYWAKSNELCFGTTGIDGVETLNLSVMPNPVIRGQRVNISVEGNADLQGARLTVFDATGRKAIEQTLNGSFESDLNAGIYMLRLCLKDGRVATKRLVVR